MTHSLRRPRARTASERMAALARPDKWFLGGLDGIQWAPPFPRWLHRPGFWDPAHVLHYAVGPVFSFALVDEEGNEVPLTPADPGWGGGDFGWRPGRSRTRWRIGSGYDVATEDRRVLAGGVLESRLWLPPEALPCRVVAYTAQPRSSVMEIEDSEPGVRWLRSVADGKDESIRLRMALGSDPAPDWRMAVPSEGIEAVPEWSMAPFAECWARCTEGQNVSEPSGLSVPDDGFGKDWVWLAVSTKLARARSVTLRASITAESEVATEQGHPPSWDEYFGGFPDLASGSPYLDRYFQYRIYGLGLNRIEGQWPNIPHPAIGEGLDYFHVPITYSAQCHMMEMRWREGGREAWGSLLNFLASQKEDGSLHGRLYPNHLTGTDYYHANWGDALLAVHDLHPDGKALRTSYEGLSRFAHWMKSERDPEDSGMFTVVNHFETGQEYMSRYMVVDPSADVNEWQPLLRLKGIDVTVYAHQLFRALARIASMVGRGGDQVAWSQWANQTGTAITDHMWSPEAGLFADVDGDAWTRTAVKAAVGFYPLLTDLVDEARIERMLDHLEDPATFGTPYPIPSSSADDPHFSAEGLWKGKRRNCPWNGRVWPMTTSHVIEGLLRCWRRGNARAGELAARMIPRFVEMMFDEGDVDRPNCYEHYNPYTGRACYFRGIDDYQHSWVLDLLVRGWAGLRVDAEGVEVHALPHGRPHVYLGPVRSRGSEVEVELNETRARVAVDGRWAEGPRDEVLRVPWSQGR